MALPKCLWKRGLRARKRYDRCLVPGGRGICGCGSMYPPHVSYRRRMTRRMLAKGLRDSVEEM